MNFYVGDARNTPLVDAGTHLGAAKAVTPMSAGCVRWGAASWRPCNVADPHQGPVPHS